MEHNIKDYNTYKIHHYKTDKYKTIDIKLIFRKPIKKEDITKTSLLFDVLLSGSNKYPTNKLINIKKEELYGTNLYGSTKRIGNYLHEYLYLNVLSDNYTESGNLEESIKLLSEVLFNPLVKNNSFDKEIVNREIGIYRNNYKNLKENQYLYTLIKGNELYNTNSVISYREIGYTEDLDNINEYNLYEYYKEFLNTNMIDFIVVGNIEFNIIDNLINKYFNSFKNSNKEDIPYLLNDKLLYKNIINKEKINNKQSNLIMIYKGDNLTDYERNYILKLYSSILGETSSSKLFKIIREEESLCYYINSLYSYIDNMLYIVAGIDKNNYDKTVENIKKIIEDTKKDLITEEDIIKEKTSITINLNNSLDDNFKISNYIEQIDILKRDSIEERKNNYNKITKQELVNTINKLKLESIFLLEGEYNETN